MVKVIVSTILLVVISIASVLCSANVRPAALIQLWIVLNVSWKIRCTSSRCLAMGMIIASTAYAVRWSFRQVKHWAYRYTSYFTWGGLALSLVELSMWPRSHVCTWSNWSRFFLGIFLCLSVCVCVRAYVCLCGACVYKCVRARVLPLGYLVFFLNAKRLSKSWMKSVGTRSVIKIFLSRSFFKRCLLKHRLLQKVD